MKQISFLALIFFSFGTFAQTTQQIDNQFAFAKTYGYLKYFYPGDEAAKIDWDKFAFYGSKKVEICKNPEELKKALGEMVTDLMPGVKILNQADAYKFDEALLKPKNLAGFDVVTWQHLGVGLVKDVRSPYQSLRTNRTTIYKTDFKGFGNASAQLDSKPFAGKTFEMTGRAKLVNGSGDGHLWLRIDDVKGKIVFFDNMDDRPIKNKKWSNFIIKGTIDEQADKILFGAFLSGIGSLLVDDISLKINGEDVYLANFENESVGTSPKNMATSSPRSTDSDSKYAFTIFKTEANHYLNIESPKGAEKIQTVNKKPFDQQVKFGEYADKAIGNNLKIIIPLSLYGSKSNTYPTVDSVKINSIIDKINNSTYNLNASDLYFRLGNLINTWNVFQHFYPYFDVAKTDWNEDLRIAIKESYETKSINSYTEILQRLTAKLKDGHISVRYAGSNNYYFAPIAWKFVGEDLVITSNLDTTLKIKRGEVVKKINGIEVNEYFIKVNQNISAATKGWLNYRAQTESIIGEKDSPFYLTMDNGNEHKLLRNMYSSAYYLQLPKQDTIKSLGNNITYISISNAKMETIRKAFPILQKSKSIICDLRGYPTDNSELIEHLLNKNDTSSKWMQIPKIIYPDQEKLVGYQDLNWGLKAKKPHLNAKIIFLIDGQAISYAESYMSFIEHYKLATIIGQPTAGTNGNVNTINLPGRYSIRFTGMKVLKHNGSQHHGIGIIPNIFVEQTVKGIKEGRDEILERAIAEALK